MQLYVFSSLIQRGVGYSSQTTLSGLTCSFILYQVFFSGKIKFYLPPGIEHYIEDFDSPPQLSEVEMQMQSLRSTWSSTGYYLPAAQEATIEVFFRLLQVIGT